MLLLLLPSSFVSCCCGCCCFFFFYKCLPLAGMTTKFNQGMYTRMRAKKNKALSNLGTKTICVMKKGGGPITTATSSTPGTEMVRTATSTTSVEELTPQRSKRQWTEDKQKEKADSQPSSI